MRPDAQTSGCSLRTSSSVVATRISNAACLTPRRVLDRIQLRRGEGSPTPSARSLACVSRRWSWTGAMLRGAAPSRSGTTAAASVLCMRPSGLHALGDELLLGEIADAAGELDLVPRDLPGVGDRDHLALEVEHLDERDVVARQLAVLEVGLALLPHPLERGLAGDLPGVGLQLEHVLLRADLRVELGRPLPGDVGGVRDERG